MTLKDFLLYLYAGGGSVMVVSFFVEYWTWFQRQTVDAKKWLSFVFSVLIGGGAYIVLTYVSQSTLDVIAPYFNIVATLFAVYFLGQAFHKVHTNLVK